MKLLSANAQMKFVRLIHLLLCGQEKGCLSLTSVVLLSGISGVT